VDGLADQQHVILKHLVRKWVVSALSRILMPSIVRRLGQILCCSSLLFHSIQFIGFSIYILLQSINHRFHRNDVSDTSSSKMKAC
jgi:hypothetical protein